MDYNTLKLQFDVDTHKIDLFLEYLIKTNENINLTAITKKDEMVEKHIYDSLLISKDISFENKLVLDVGSGGGFPGIPLAILYPTAKFVLLDSTGKKVSYLNEVLKYLNLKNVETKCARVESLKENEKYDIVISRAFSDLSIYLELVAYLAKVGGQIVAMKGPKGNEEYFKAKNAIKKLNLDSGKVYTHELPSDKATRLNIVFTKKKSTDKKYPRNYADILKKPL